MFVGSGATVESTSMLISIDESDIGEGGVITVVMVVGFQNDNKVRCF
jgi:hypothetical protein